ncbi:MAG: SPOR domain-containing protein [Gammaproteobacteria bacterium]|nr:SPOR domain-containing protein [Gammaproteobacteria bacterium]
MNQQLKQRVIGAIVLISAAVIFIPALLDGSHKNVSPLQERQTPQKPNFYFEDIKLPKSVDAVKTPSRIIEDKRDVSKLKPLVKPSVESKANDETPKSIIRPDKVSVNPNSPSAWVVQIASLTNSERALELRDKLKKLGFSAFVEEIPKDGKKFYRVRVGPELKQAEAEALQQRIKKKMKLEGNVLRYHPL